MNKMDFSEEAQRCRQQALVYAGQPEAPFLIRVAREFDRLAVDPVRAKRSHSSDGRISVEFAEALHSENGSMLAPVSRK